MTPAALWSPWETAFYKLARDYGDMAMSMVNSGSGADQADSEKYFEMVKVWREVAAAGSEIGADALGAIVADADRRWRAYAAEQAAKVANAPKIKRGPMSGHSVISHRWVSPEAIVSQVTHIYAMVRITRERIGKTEKRTMDEGGAK